MWLNVWQPRSKPASIRQSCGDGLGGLLAAPPEPLPVGVEPELQEAIEHQAEEE
jgi:hypothetical protein